MSTESVSITRTRLRPTMRGRRFIATIVAAPVVAAVVFGAFSGGAALASHADGAPQGTFSTVTVMPGETLWAIAERFAPSADPRDVIDAIESLNQIEAGSITAGERIALPAEYSAQ